MFLPSAGPDVRDDFVHFKLALDRRHFCVSVFFLREVGRLCLWWISAVCRHLGTLAARQRL